MSDLKEQVQFKEGRISGYLAVSDYKKCDEIKEETIQLKKQLRELETGKKRLATSSRQSKWYYSASINGRTSDTFRSKLGSVWSCDRLFCTCPDIYIVLASSQLVD